MSLLDFMGMANNPDVQEQIGKFLKLGDELAEVSRKVDVLTAVVNQLSLRIGGLQRMAVEERRLKGITLPVPSLDDVSPYLDRINNDGNI